MACNSVAQYKFFMRWIVSDDDNIMRAHSRHPNSTDKKDKGKLPKWVYQSKFMAYPGHRKKSVAEYFYRLANASVGTSRVTKGMAKRLKKIGVI